jgi:hypothetical protein
VDAHGVQTAAKQREVSMPQQAGKQPVLNTDVHVAAEIIEGFPPHSFVFQNIVATSRRAKGVSTFIVVGSQGCAVRRVKHSGIKGLPPLRSWLLLRN